MSVMIMSDESVKRIAKYLSLTNGEELAIKKALKMHELNIKNFVERYKHHGEKFNGLYITKEQIELNDIPIPHPAQFLSDLGGIYYNCIDYGKEIDEKTLNMINGYIDKIKTCKQFEQIKQYYDHAVYN